MGRNAVAFAWARMVPPPDGVVLLAAGQARMVERDLRLVAPRLSDAELVFMLELFKLKKGVEDGIRELNHALLEADIEAGIRAARRFTSLGVLMDEAQKKVTRS